MSWNGNISSNSKKKKKKEYIFQVLKKSWFELFECWKSVSGYYNFLIALNILKRVIQYVISQDFPYVGNNFCNYIKFKINKFKCQVKHVWGGT